MSPLLQRCVLAAGVVLGGGGSTGCGGKLAGAAFALGASAVSRAQGGCYASCPTGTVCNEKTGLCDVLPCRGQCGPHEECIEDGLASRCIAVTTPGGNITVQPPASSGEKPPTTSNEPVP